jgi:hypothetical protein
MTQNEGTVIHVQGMPITAMSNTELADAIKALRVKRGITSQTRKASGSTKLGGGGGGTRAKKQVDLSDAEEL